MDTWRCASRGCATRGYDGLKTCYNFRYNEFGQMTEIALGNLTPRRIGGFNPETGEFDQTQGGLTRDVGNRHVLKSYEYHPVDRLLTSRAYANGHRVYYGYDFLRRVTERRHSDGTRFTYSYTGDGQLHSIRDYAPNSATPRRSYEYIHDTLGRLINFTERDGNDTVLQHGSHSFDDAGRLSGFHYAIPGVTPAGGRSNAFQFHPGTGNLTRMDVATGDDWRLEYTYDNLQRLRSRQLIYERYATRLPWETRYAYWSRGGTTSSMQVRWMTHQIGGESLSFEYEYDNIGQIAQWWDMDRDIMHEYQYDAQNQLVEERITQGGGNQRPVFHHEFHYIYDTFGNIRERSHTTYFPEYIERVMRFSYDYDLWPDLLTAVNGREITYDHSGNPTAWHDGRRFTWERGRQLTRAQGNGLDVTFEYDVNGIRTGKSVHQ